MNLLIVDDEEITRTGLISSINWKKLGIENVYQADDGINGLACAKEFHPEIILCDVRMPRMDGITMLHKIHEISPNTIPIFMSGYSDVEYLKAAIKLKAVTYIEKPFDLEEVQDAILEAQKLYLNKVRSNEFALEYTRENAFRLAKHLTSPYGRNADEINRLSGVSNISIDLEENTGFISFVVKTNILSTEVVEQTASEILRKLQGFLHSVQMDALFTERRGQYFVYFVFGPAAMLSTLTRFVLHLLQDEFKAFGKYYIACGDIVTGISQAYNSFSSAILRLESSFFFPSGTVLTSDFAVSDDFLSEELISDKDFLQKLSSEKEASCMEYLNQLYSCFNQNPNVFVNYVKDLYYKYFLAIEEARKQKKLLSHSKQGSIMETLEKCFSHEDLHHILTEQVQQYFADLSQIVQENPTIQLIRQFISENYQRDTLSVKDISNEVFLSTSYVCTFFKNETGQTLNQYLTEYRMEKAKALLADPRFRISDISSQVGYTDGNYFGKSFKKYTGYTPSEYREKNI